MPKEVKETKSKSEGRHGTPMSEEELEEYFQAFQDIEESIQEVNENGTDM